MNRHFHGPTHGLPLHELEKHRRLHDPFSRLTNSESLHARIVDDKLLVLSVKTLSYSQGDSKTLRSYVDSHGHEVCEHLTLTKECTDYIYASRQLPELAMDRTTAGHFTPCDQSFGSCAFCLTDYCIDISWRGRRKGCLIKISVYRQLGDCRSPFDCSLRIMTTSRRVEEPRTAYPLEYRAGIVRDRWNKADGIHGRTQSEWVQIPGLASLR